MGLDSGIGTNVDRSGFECTLHDTEALLDLPALMVCVCNFTRFFICKIGGYGVESVKAFFLTNVFITNALYFLFSNFPVFRTTLRFDQTPKIVGVFLCKMCIRDSLSSASKPTLSQCCAVVLGLMRIRHMNRLSHILKNCCRRTNGRFHFGLRSVSKNIIRSLSLIHIYSILKPVQ